MRDSWFPIAAILIVLIGIWLGIFGPLPNGFANWLQHWQTLAAALVASIAAYIAIQNTTRSLRHTEKLEKHRRERKHAALRATLPLALAQVTNYAEASANALDGLVKQCTGETLPKMTAPKSLAEPLPSETLKTLADFIEYSDEIDVSIIESTVSWIQIHDSRLHDLVQRNRDLSGTRLIVRTNIKDGIIVAASIYAGAAAVFEYARRKESQLPRRLLWDAVGGALRNMGFWEDEHPRLYESISRRESRSSGPFER